MTRTYKFDELVLRVAMVNEEAANILQQFHDDPMQRGFYHRSREASCNIYTLLNWSRTPQAHCYWSEVNTLVSSDNRPTILRELNNTPDCDSCIREECSGCYHYKEKEDTTYGT